VTEIVLPAESAPSQLVVNPTVHRAIEAAVWGEALTVTLEMVGSIV
jgi:hypothetical protein